MRPLLLLLLLLSQACLAATNCKYGYSIDTVSEDGARVTLEDGSVWEIYTLDRISSVQWQPAMSIGLCPGKIINTELGETLTAIRAEPQY